MRCLVLDLETVPCLTMGERVFGIDFSIEPDPRVAYEHMVSARLAETEGKTDFQKPALHRIVGLGMVGFDTDRGIVQVHAQAGEQEAELIAAAHSWMKGEPVLVGWNTLGFDLPVLRYRALFQSVTVPLFWTGQKNFERLDYRYGDRHIDLCDVLSCYGRSTALKLSEAAALFDLPCKTRGAGDRVLPLWMAGRYEEIRAYVEEDARVTARIFLRWWESRGRPMHDAIDAQLAGATVAV